MADKRIVLYAQGARIDDQHWNPGDTLRDPDGSPIGLGMPDRTVYPGSNYRVPNQIWVTGDQLVDPDNNPLAGGGWTADYGASDDGPVVIGIGADFAEADMALDPTQTGTSMDSPLAINSGMEEAY